ncbi:MAG: type I phosphomannose isomerase catalytic subunit [Peptoniphilaceae bacterium]|nr:mannose-6-phosphate isomerase [Peptoniphilaceae bacterium]MDD7383758.1 mannose-6-phosphate isomerase [Peptoniphilaceae bacterium]MDY3737843.1 type I phosphomannose isomerase catalytic subunit [Peptoniphilaceae bacterium]
MQSVLFLKGKTSKKIRGGNKLNEFYVNTNKEKIGEYRAVSAMENMSSVILNGEYKGIEFEKFYKENKSLFSLKSDRFPLLIKLIDANDDLSIQVHPNEEMAKKNHAFAKNECWYFLNEKESSIVYGLNENEKEKVIEKIKKHKRNELLSIKKVKKDDFYYVPAGVVHAIKKGCFVLEIQQASDTTYRLYDYGRKDEKGNLRELHLKEAISSIDYEKHTFKKFDEEKKENYTFTKLIKNDFFSVNKYEIEKKSHIKKNNDYVIESVISGKGKLKAGKEEYEIKKGDFFILLNNMNDFEIDGNLTMIESF